MYTGGYGRDWIVDVAQESQVAVGTSLGLSTTYVDDMINYLLGGAQWMIYGYNFDPSVDGRELSRSDTNGDALDLIPAVQTAISLGNGYDQTQLQSMLSQLQYSQSSSGNAADPTQAISGNRNFWTSDYMVQRGNGYFLSVKTSSTRTNLPEYVNGEDAKGLLGYDGVNMIMVTGNEYKNIEPVWDWYRLPGTTTERSPTGYGGTYSLTPEGGVEGATTTGSTSFVGGASNGTNGNEALLYNHLNVSANKSWFFFGNEEVALGCNIDAPNAASTDIIGTNINQCLQTSNVTYETTTSQQTLSSGSVTPSNLQWVNQGNVGYFFLSPVSNVTIQAQQQSGSWYAINPDYSNATITDNVFSLDIMHGERPENASYQYIVVPGLSSSQMSSYLASNPITVLSNTATVQAVQQSTLGITQAIFYSPGSLTAGSSYTITQTTHGHGSSILMDETGNQLNISVASPDQWNGTMSYQINLDLSGPGASWSAANGYTTLNFALPTGSYAGSTVTEEYTIVGVPEPEGTGILFLGILCCFFFAPRR